MLTGTLTAAVGLLLMQGQTVAPDLPTIYVIGDSTAKNTGRRGWGDPFAEYFDPAKIHVVNRARGGRSSRTYFTEGLWTELERELKPGDFVLIQFGHNDGGPPGKDRARGSLHGVGDQSREFTLPDGNTEVVHTFGWYLRTFIAGAKAKGATPIVLSPTVRNIWTDHHVERGPGNYAQWSAEVAHAEHVDFVDVTNAIADEYERLGEDKVKQFFPEDHTHTSEAGADLNASLVVAGLKGLRDRSLVAFLSPEGQAVESYPTPLNRTRTTFRMPEPSNPSLPTLFIIGDSTVRNGHGNGANGLWGWGEPIADFFDPAKINVVNRAVGGLSSRTYLTYGHWDRVLAMLKAGDFVLMQFGHNDASPLDDPARARGTLPGIGDETRDVDNPITEQREVVHTYGWYLKKFVIDTRAKGATPIICSPIPRMNWKEGRIVRSGDYGAWAREVAEGEGVAFVDLNAAIARQYDAMGPDKVAPLFPTDHTHTSRAGAELNAGCVVAGLSALPKNPLAPYFNGKAASTGCDSVPK